MKILIAEDETIQRRLLESLLTGWGHEVAVATNGTQAWAMLQGENRPDLTILDWMMPGMDGLRVCAELRKDSSQTYVYIVLLTARNRKQDLLQALDAGADDYLVKPFDAQELKARLKAGKRILDLQEQLVSANRNLQFQATHDSLTGLLNRRAIVEILQKELARAERERESLSIILVDIDHFKKINDTRGHLAGDAVLCRVSQIMKSSVRSYDSVGRYGGEEFLIVLPGCPAELATKRAEQFGLMLSEPSSDPSENQITVSMGVAVGSGPIKMEELLSRADDALYQAKRNGRNRVESAKGTRYTIDDQVSAMTRDSSDHL
jgi:two-component system, cell cycle response regulator